MVCTSSVTTAVGALAAAALLVLTTPPPAALRQVRDPGSADAPTDLLVAALALVSAALVVWLALTVLLTAGGRLPGAAGSAARRLVRLVAPAAVRRAAELVLGVGLASGALGAGPAAAGAPPATTAADPVAVAAATDHEDAATPTAGVPRAVADLDWPVPALEAPAPVVVGAGDTLWGLAEQALRASGGVEPSAAQVAQAWPLWWSANRQVVGDDPDLILPGTALVPPPPPAGPVDGTP